LIFEYDQRPRQVEPGVQRGRLKSANIVQAEDRTRVVLNLNKAMTYEATIDGNSLLLALVPSCDTRQHAAGRAFRQGSVRRGRRTAFAT
jgi:type IV pilus assembly protein PilQ